MPLTLEVRLDGASTAFSGDKASATFIVTASTLHAAAAPPERPIASRAVTGLAAAFLHRSVAGAPDMPPPSPRQLLPAVSPRRSSVREPPVRRTSNAPLLSRIGARGAQLACSLGEAPCCSGDAGG